MFKLWRGKSRIVIACLLLLTIAVGGWVLAECYPYPNSRIEYHFGVAVCAGTGSGCTECVNDNSGSCVTNGESCIPSGPETKN